jgi:hypothetical protein
MGNAMAEHQKRSRDAESHPSQDVCTRNAGQSDLAAGLNVREFE